MIIVDRTNSWNCSNLARYNFSAKLRMCILRELWKEKREMGAGWYLLGKLKSFKFLCSRQEHISYSANEDCAQQCWSVYSLSVHVLCGSSLFCVLIILYNTVRYGILYCTTLLRICVGKYLVSVFTRTNVTLNENLEKKSFLTQKNFSIIMCHT